MCEREGQRATNTVCQYWSANILRRMTNSYQWNAVFPDWEQNIPNLGMKRSQVGKNEALLVARVVVLVDVSFETFAKNLSSLPQSLKTCINTGGLSDERFFASLPHLSCISPYSMRDVGRDQGGKRERLRKSPPSRNACVQRLFGRLRERWLFLQRNYLQKLSPLPLLYLSWL